MDFAPNPDHEAIVEAVDNVCSQFDDNYWSDCDERAPSSRGTSTGRWPTGAG